MTLIARHRPAVVEFLGRSSKVGVSVAEHRIKAYDITKRISHIQICLLYTSRRDEYVIIIADDHRQGSDIIEGIARHIDLPALAVAE